MNEHEILGYIVSAVITLGGFAAVIMKFIQPINELRVVIQKLNDAIDTLKDDTLQQNRKIEKHDEQIDKLDSRVGTLETKMNMYHREGPS